VDFSEPSQECSHANETAFTSNASLSRAGTRSERLSRHVRVMVHGPAKKATLFDGHYLRKFSPLDIGVLGYIGIV
jgi:hypothetical protein